MNPGTKSDGISLPYSEKFYGILELLYSHCFLLCFFFFIHSVSFDSLSPCNFWYVANTSQHCHWIIKCKSYINVLVFKNLHNSCYNGFTPFTMFHFSCSINFFVVGFFNSLYTLKWKTLKTHISVIVK